MPTLSFDKILEKMIAEKTYVSAKTWRRAIDKNKEIRQKLLLQKEYIERFGEFSRAAKDAARKGEYKFEFEDKSFTARSALRTVAAVEGRRNESVGGMANFRQQNYMMKRLFPELTEGQELGHKNISVLRASLAMVIDNMETDDPRRSALVKLFAVVKTIDGLTEDDELSLDEVLDRLESMAEEGFTVKGAIRSDINILTGGKQGGRLANITFEYENREFNQATGSLAALAGEIFKQIIEDIEVSNAQFWNAVDILDISGSPTVGDRIGDQYFNLIDPKRKVKKSSMSKRSTKKDKGAELKIKRRRKIRPKAPVQSNQQSAASLPLHLIGLINKQLPRTLEKNMGPPRLTNQTGRFADSVRLTDMVATPQGFPSIGYTYQKDPYQVFEKGDPFDPQYDPRILIDQSIREIAAQFAIGRFYTRRE
jgi:hypothetical protein